MKAFLKNYRQSPRKVRLIADLIRNKDVKTARLLLSITPKRAAIPIKKLLDSAISNARLENSGEENLFVKNVQVNEGPTLKRMRARARGSANIIRKRTSRIVIMLGEKNIVKKQEPKTKKLKTSKKTKPKV